MPIDWGPLIAGGSSILGGFLGSRATKKAAGDAKDAARKSLHFQERMFRRTRDDFAPFLSAGQQAISDIKGVDPTGGAGEFMDSLRNYGTNFQFDSSNPVYQQRLSESQKQIDSILASRGLYNSRPGMNMISDAQNQIAAEEFGNQYQRGYSNLIDLFNMSTKLGGLNYSKLLDLVKVGTGAAGSTGSAAMQTGQGVASSYGDMGFYDAVKGGANRDFWSGVGAMPLNYMILSNMFKKPTAGGALAYPMLASDFG